MTKKRQKPRNIRRYHYWWRGKVVHRGVTKDLEKREQDHKQKWPGGHIQQIGPSVTKDTSLKWEREGGKRIKRKKSR